MLTYNLLIFITLDALQIRLWAKIGIGIMISLYLLSQAIRFTFFSTVFGRTDDSIIEYSLFGADFSISLLSIMGGSMRTLAIFTGGQVVSSVRKKGKCALIKYFPYVEWIDADPVKDIPSKSNGNKLDDDDVHDDEQKTAEMIEINYEKEMKETDSDDTDSFMQNENEIAVSYVQNGQNSTRL